MSLLTGALVLALIFGSGAAIALFHAGARYIRSGGDKAKVEFARTTMVSAIISGILAVIAIGTIELLGLALVPGWTTEHPGLWLVVAAAGFGPALYLMLTVLLAGIPALTRQTREWRRREHSFIPPTAAARSGVAALLRRWRRTALLPVVACIAWFAAFGALGLYWTTRQVIRLAALPLPADERPDFIESQRFNVSECDPWERARYLLGMLFGCVRMGMIRRRRLARLDEAVVRDAAVTVPRTHTLGAARHWR